MKFIKKNWRKLFLLTYVLILPISVIYAADNSVSSSTGKLDNPIPNINTIPNFIQTILTGFLKIGIPVVALAIIYSGFLFVAARGNSEKLTKAKDTLLYTIIGAAILLGAWAIATMISSTVLAL